jgi:hypothetical protein
MGEKRGKGRVDHRDGARTHTVWMDEDFSENGRDDDLLVVSGSQERRNGSFVVLIGRAEVGDENARVED